MWKERVSHDGRIWRYNGKNLLVWFKPRKWRSHGRQGNNCTAEFSLLRFIFSVAPTNSLYSNLKSFTNSFYIRIIIPQRAQIEGSGQCIKCEIVMKSTLLKAIYRYRISQGYAYCLREKLNSSGLHYNRFIINALRVEIKWIIRSDQHEWMEVFVNHINIILAYTQFGPVQSVRIKEFQLWNFEFELNGHEHVNYVCYAV